MFKKSIILLSIMFMAFVSLNYSVTAQSRYNMSYLYFFNTDNYIKIVDKTHGSLNVVSPNYFDINQDGSLKITTKLKRSFIEDMHKKNVKVVPFLSNHWDKLIGVSGLEKREELAESIANAIELFNLDGVNVDIEGVSRGTMEEPDKYRDAFTDFVKLLREKVPSDKEVSVAVAANPSNWQKGWHGFYDYQKLSNYADYLMIMAYDEHWDGSQPGAVASIDFVEKSILYALNQGVLKEKIVLGIPFYGRIWHLEDIDNKAKSSSEKIMGDGVSLYKAKEMIDLFDAVVTFDERTKTYVTTFKIEENSPVYHLYSWKDSLSMGTYKLYFEDERSIKEKLNLVQKYDLKGTGSWSLGQEDTRVWDYYRLWLDGKIFSDVSNDYWAREEILKVQQKNWMKGTSSTTFSPMGELTRAQAAVVLVRALGLTNDLIEVTSFSDVNEKYWAYKEIEIAKKYGIFAGRSNGMFDGDSPITREQMAVVLHRIVGDDDTETLMFDNFKDVEEGNWAYQSISVMKQREIFGGYDDGSFKPKDNITRAQMAALMNRIELFLK